MLGRKNKQFESHVISLDAFVPASNFYRWLEERLPLDFVNGLVQDQYASRGRPSIDPIVFFKLQLIMWWFVRRFVLSGQAPSYLQQMSGKSALALQIES